jgi:hypothetical protein
MDNDDTASMDEEGAEDVTRARSRSLIDVLLIAVGVGAAAWVIGEIGFGVAILTNLAEGRWIAWSQAVQGVGSALCLGSAATLIAMLTVARWGR